MIELYVIINPNNNQIINPTSIDQDYNFVIEGITWGVAARICREFKNNMNPDKPVQLLICTRIEKFNYRG